MTRSTNWTILQPIGSNENEPGEIELIVEYSCRLGYGPIIGGPPEACDPGEPSEFEIEDVSRAAYLILPGWESWHGTLCLMPAEEAKLIDMLDQNPPEDDYFDEDYDYGE